MYAMSAQTVADSSNKYRHGVLIGNFVQDKFGIDLARKGPQPDAQKIPTTKQHHDLSHSLYTKNQIISSLEPINKTFYDTAKQSNISGDYIRPQKLTSYQIFHQPQLPASRVSNVLQNNSKKQNYLNQNNMLYEQTRYFLGNKVANKQDLTSIVVQQQIPDILTGQIAKHKKQLVVQSLNQNRQLKTKLDSNISTKSVNPYGTYSLIKPQIKKIQEVEYKNLVYPTNKGQQRDMLFGHGLALDDFQKRQLATSYDLSYNQKVKPQVQVNSFYQPGLSQTSKHFHKNQVYEKNHQIDIPLYGTKQILANPKVARPYQPYTKTYDLNHLKHEYLRK